MELVFRWIEDELRMQSRNPHVQTKIAEHESLVTNMSEVWRMHFANIKPLCLEPCKSVDDVSPFLLIIGFMEVQRLVNIKAYKCYIKLCLKGNWSYFVGWWKSPMDPEYPDCWGSIASIWQLWRKLTCSISLSLLLNCTWLRKLPVVKLNLNSFTNI
jgi:hypothetical protein